MKDSNHAKTTVFNLIILDESGSMAPVVQQTISGCNENLDMIRSNAEKYSDTMRQLVSIYAFHGSGTNESRYIVKNASPSQVKNIGNADYCPTSMTPLLDAVGSTLSELKAVSETHEDTTGIITIITDGYENSSRTYNWRNVADLIGYFKEKGWTVNLIGANIDVDKMADTMGIDNRMAFKNDQEGTHRMFRAYTQACRSRMSEIDNECKIEDESERLMARKTRSKRFFGR